VSPLVLADVTTTVAAVSGAIAALAALVTIIFAKQSAGAGRDSARAGRDAAQAGRDAVELEKAILGRGGLPPVRASADLVMPDPAKAVGVDNRAQAAD
jgi:hypothetical protein